MPKESNARRVGAELGLQNHAAKPPALRLVLAINAVLPPPTRGSGRRRAMLELFNNRVTWQAVQHWLAGRCAMPDWAIDSLAKANREKRQHHEHIEALLKEKAPN